MNNVSVLIHSTQPIGIVPALTNPTIFREKIKSQFSICRSQLLECVSKREIRKFEQILCQFKEETRRLSSAKSRVDDAEMAQKMPKLRIKEFLRHTLEGSYRSAETLRVA